ncbi:MAG TPA: WGR domain-containing protein [Gammaproteobacteria bacterium]|nr:WGR domain-containing protein [Gammaproteobacteria bacterium]
MRIYMQTPVAAGQTPRFCQLMLQRDLLGGWSLTRESGEQGRAGRIRRAHFARLDEAQAQFQQWRDKQLRLGYRIVYMEGMEMPT